MSPRGHVIRGSSATVTLALEKSATINQLVIMIGLTAKLPSPFIRIGGQFPQFRQQPALSARWRHRIQADASTGSIVAEESLSGSSLLRSARPFHVSVCSWCATAIIIAHSQIQFELQSMISKTRLKTKTRMASAG